MTMKHPIDLTDAALSLNIVQLEERLAATETLQKLRRAALAIAYKEQARRRAERNEDKPEKRTCK